MPGAPSGRVIYGGRMLAVRTSDIIIQSGEGGVLLAKIPAHARVEGNQDRDRRSWDGRVRFCRPNGTVPNVPPFRVRGSETSDPTASPSDLPER